MHFQLYSLSWPDTAPKAARGSWQLASGCPILCATPPGSLCILLPKKLCIPGTLINAHFTQSQPIAKLHSTRCKRGCWQPERALESKAMLLTKTQSSPEQHVLVTEALLTCLPVKWISSFPLDTYFGFPSTISHHFLIEFSTASPNPLSCVTLITCCDVETKDLIISNHLINEELGVLSCDSSITSLIILQDNY